MAYQFPLCSDVVMVSVSSDGRVVYREGEIWPHVSLASHEVVACCEVIVMLQGMGFVD